MTQTPNIFVDALPWDFRSRNVDWHHIRTHIPRLAEFEPDLHFYTPQSRWQTVCGNLKTIRAAAGRRIGMPLSEADLWTHHLPARELALSGANVVFAQSFPLNAPSLPVVWHSAVLDPDMQQSYGTTAQTMQDEVEFKREFFHRAATVMQFSEVEVQRHRADFPESADRFCFVPYFTPHLHACDKAHLLRHRNAAPVRILFVGNHALRKGLPQLLEAFQALPAPVLHRAELTIISNFDRSPMAVPDHPRIKVLYGAPSDVVLRHMREAHILVNVAHFESYGVVFMEAMSQGTVCLGPIWEVQREFFDNGTAGLNLRCEATDIRIALERLIDDEELRLRIGHAAWLRFQHRYATDKAAARYRDLFSNALHR